MMGIGKLIARLTSRLVTAAGATFPASEMAAPVKALRKAGFVCNESLAEKLWSRFSQDQCATWIQICDESVAQFVVWVCHDMDRDEAWM